MSTMSAVRTITHQPAPSVSAKLLSGCTQSGVRHGLRTDVVMPAPTRLSAPHRHRPAGAPGCRPRGWAPVVVVVEQVLADRDDRAVLLGDELVVHVAQLAGDESVGHPRQRVGCMCEQASGCVPGLGRAGTGPPAAPAAACSRAAGSTPAEHRAAPGVEAHRSRPRSTTAGSAAGRGGQSVSRLCGAGKRPDTTCRSAPAHLGQDVAGAQVLQRRPGLR